MVVPKSPLTDSAVRKVAAHASEGGHWYDRHGQLIEEVTGARGQPVRPDLRHARKLQLCRGVTSIIAACSKPQLELWKRRQAILSALTLPRGETESENDWLARVEEDCGQTAAKAAEEGTRIHAAIQAHIQATPYDSAYVLHVSGVLQALDATCGIQAWRSEVPVVSSLGFATKLDLLSDEWLIDFKGKDGDYAELSALKAYDDHAMQLAAGIIALGPERRAAICFVSRTHPGVARLVEVEPKQLERGAKMFVSLLDYTFAKDSYKPEWAEN